MKRVTLYAKVDPDICRGCGICEKVCPVKCIRVVDRKAYADPEKCMACANCADRCPFYAIQMIEREDPFEVGVDVSKFDKGEIRALCEKARLNPEQVLCYCVGVRAEEAAAAILDGADTPEEVSRRTGIRTGCTIECIQPILRLLEAAGHELQPDPNGWQWYGRTATVWDISQEVIDKYNARGFYFKEDKALLEEIIAANKER